VKRLLLGLVPAAGLGLALVAACQVVARYDEFAAGTTTGAAHPCAPLPARLTGADVASLRGPALVRIDRLDGTCFYIDETEVTIQQYEDFRAETDPAGPSWTPIEFGQDCSWKDGGASQPNAPGCDPAPGPEQKAPFGLDKPARCIDWCDARAYCRWAGKRLCNAKPQSSGVYSSSTDVDDWAYACGGTDVSRPYPVGSEDLSACIYGQTEGGACTVSGSCGPTSSGCSTPEGVKNLAGNVAEWTVACSAGDGGAAKCVVVGGSYDSPEQELACIRFDAEQRSARLPTVGFRCCAKPPG
jgi:sulfatase modifying factor 1